jgi:amidohydrolase
MDGLRSRISDLMPQAVETRHDLHAHPELVYEERRTSEVVQKTLSELKIEHRAGLAGGTGVLGYIPATKSGGGTIALRADMDALPILEETGLPYASQNPGKMHACGHDGHTTILLTAAKALSQTPDRQNDILLVFQPAEEGGAGGNRMCEDGVLDGRILGKKVDLIYGLHGHPRSRLGEVSTRVGPLMASATQFKIHVTGKGTHAAFPHFGIDPIVVSSQMILALQTIASRNVDPLEAVVVTIGKLEAGVAHNVISETALLHGTLRTLNDGVLKTAWAAIERIAKGTAEALGATAEVEWEAVPYPVTRNDAGATERFRTIARQAIGHENVAEVPNPMMGGEDFSFYGLHVPACFFFLGLLPEDKDLYPALHAPRFDFNDAAMPLGVEVMCHLALSPV